jgi:hypothetical protein
MIRSVLELPTTTKRDTEVFSREAIDTPPLNCFLGEWLIHPNHL